MTSLVLPAYNPGPQALERAWAGVRAFVRTRPDPWDAVFVLDGCTDGSDLLAARLARTLPDARLRVLSYPVNRGKGYAVRAGLLAARGAWRLFTDVDLAYHFDDVARVADELRLGADVAIAAREHPDSQVTLPNRALGYAYRRRLQSRAFGRLARTLLPVPFRDTQAGLKGLTARAAQLLLPNVRCRGFGFDCELLTAAARYNLTVGEVSVTVRLDDCASTTRAGTTLRMARDLWRIRRRWRPGAFPAPAPVAAGVTVPAGAYVGAAA